MPGGRPSELVLVGLTAVAASTDALSYIGLNEVFPANMTGNTVLLGVGLSTGDFARAGRSAVALGAFLVGALVAGLLTAGRPRRQVVTVGTVVELAMLGSAFGWWLALGSAPSSAPEHGLIALVATAMGVQSATVRRLGLGVSTTYITGTWTQVSMWASSLVRRHAEDSRGTPDSAASHARQSLVVVTYLCAAVLAGYVSHVAGPPAVAIPLGVLAIVALARVTARLWHPSAPAAPRPDPSLINR